METAVTETPVIDFHSHMGAWGRHGMDDDVSLVLRVMDAAGIDRACINTVHFGDPKEGNDRIARRVSLWPDRFIGAAFITPHYPDEMIPELERAFDHLGLRFLKIYPTYVRRAHDDPVYFPVLEWANDRSLVVMSHAKFRFDEESVTIPGRYEFLVKRFPRVRWVLAHAAGGINQEAVDAARRLPNLYLETCSSGLANGAIEFAVQGVGEDKVLFGTDMPLLDGVQQLAKVETAQISDQAKRKILGLNAIRLLEL